MSETSSAERSSAGARRSASSATSSGSSPLSAMSSTTSSSGSSLNEVTWLPIVKAVMSASACHDDGAVKAGLLHASVLASPRSAASPLIGYERALLPLCGDVPSGHKTGYARYEDVPQSFASRPEQPATCLRAALARKGRRRCHHLGVVPERSRQSVPARGRGRGRGCTPGHGCQRDRGPVRLGGGTAGRLGRRGWLPAARRRGSCPARRGR